MTDKKMSASAESAAENCMLCRYGDGVGDHWDQCPARNEIIVLEDMKSRVDWIRGAIAGTPGFVTWCKTVANFRMALNRNPRPAAIILDHDLGTDSTTGPDENGETGTDAARAVQPGCKAPVVVWSINRYRADNMVADLRSKGVAAQRVPFVSDNHWSLTKFAVESLRGVR